MQSAGIKPKVHQITSKDFVQPNPQKVIMRDERLKFTKGEKIVALSTTG